MEVDKFTIRNHVDIIKDHLKDIVDGLDNEASKKFFRMEARSIINQAEFILEEALEDDD